jgi:hypothetical protein
MRSESSNCLPFASRCLFRLSLSVVKRSFCTTAHQENGDFLHHPGGAALISHLDPQLFAQD